jgi:L-seryl-tRNA(Ser) seleniumtransferase
LEKEVKNERYPSGNGRLIVEKQQALRNLPSVHRLLSDSVFKQLITRYSHPLVAEAVGDEIADIRNSCLASLENEIDEGWYSVATSPASISENARQRLSRSFDPSLRRVLNVTGVVIHTNLGRAPLSKRALEAVGLVASSYSNLEFDIEAGKRGSRHAHVERHICRLTGAESALVVNNNAAAVLLVLRELGRGGEAIVSRGQLVEIGGSFRIPDVMTESDVSLIEVGTTNKTRVTDYEQAITSETKLIVRVHTSNYRIVGFTSEPLLRELVRLAHEKDLPVYEDLGSGALFDFESVSVGDEKPVRHSIEAGVDVVSFSGDKLLGSAQAGIIAGKKVWIDRMKKNPLLRALRPDKMTLAALEATLVDYELGKSRDVPVVRMLVESREDVLQRTRWVFEQLQGDNSPLNPLEFHLVDDEAEVGGGALPLLTIPSPSISVRSERIHADQIFRVMRNVPDTPIIARIVNEQVLLNLRTLLPGEEALLVKGLCACAASLRQSV